MATILERNKNKKTQRKTREEYAEDALYREVWEDVNNEKTMRFLKLYSRHLIAGALIVLILVVGFQLIRHNRNTSKIAAAQNYEMAVNKMDHNALAALAKNSNGATADLALFQSFMIDSDISKLELLADKGDTRDFRDLAKLHIAAMKGDTMSASDFEKYLLSMDTKRSPFYYNAALMIAQKYLSVGDRDNAVIWLDKIISDKEAPAVISGTAESLK